MPELGLLTNLGRLCYDDVIFFRTRQSLFIDYHTCRSHCFCEDYLLLGNNSFTGNFTPVLCPFSGSWLVADCKEEVSCACCTSCQ